MTRVLGTRGATRGRRTILLRTCGGSFRGRTRTCTRCSGGGMGSGGDANEDLYEMLGWGDRAVVIIYCETDSSVAIRRSSRPLPRPLDFDLCFVLSQPRRSKRRTRCVNCRVVKSSAFSQPTPGTPHIQKPEQMRASRARLGRAACNTLLLQHTFSRASLAASSARLRALLRLPQQRNHRSFVINAGTACCRRAASCTLSPSPLAH